MPSTVRVIAINQQLRDVAARIFPCLSIDRSSVPEVRKIFFRILVSVTSAAATKTALRRKPGFVACFVGIRNEQQGSCHRIQCKARPHEEKCLSKDLSESRRKAEQANVNGSFIPTSVPNPRV